MTYKDYDDVSTTLTNYLKGKTINSDDPTSPVDDIIMSDLTPIDIDVSKYPTGRITRKVIGYVKQY